ncbi:MAG: hypothetical protein ACK4YF_05050 [Exilispira sp.]
MKRSIIILISLIVLSAMPVLAKPMIAVTNPLIDDAFMLQELNNEELLYIIGDGAILENWLGYEVNFHFNDNGNVAIITVGNTNFLFLDYNNDGSIDQFDLVFWAENHPEYNLTAEDLVLLGGLLFGWNFRYDRPLNQREREQLKQIFSDPKTISSILGPN